MELLAFVVTNPGSNTKAFCSIGHLASNVRKELSTLFTEEMSAFTFVVDSDAVRHTLAQHGVAKSHSEALRGQIPIVESDLLALESWLPTASIIRAGQVKPGKQPRVEMEFADASGTTVAVMEWRPGRQQLALVTMYKKRPIA